MVDIFYCYCFNFGWGGWMGIGFFFFVWMLWINFDEIEFMQLCDGDFVIFVGM